MKIIKFLEVYGEISYEGSLWVRSEGDKWKKGERKERRKKIKLLGADQAMAVG